MCVAVVFFCHSNSSRAVRFLFRAQDRNMTNGDFVFFSRNLRTHERPWDQYVDDPKDRPYRRKAFYAVKQVD